MDHNQVLAFISKIHDEMAKHIDPALLIPPEELELAPLTSQSDKIRRQHRYIPFQK